MAENKTYPEGTKKETEEFTKRKEIKKLVDKAIKEIATEETYKAFKAIGYEEKQDHYFVYAKGEDDKDYKEGGKGTSENKVNVTFSYPKKYSDGESAPAISNMQKITTFGGKKLVSELYISIKGAVLDITYKNTEDSGFHQQSTGSTYKARTLEDSISISNIGDLKTFKNKIKKFFQSICKAEAEYLTGTKIAQDDKIEKKQNASIVMENKFKLSLTSLIDGDLEQLSESVYKMASESIDTAKNSKEDEEEVKDLLVGSTKEDKEQVDELTGTVGGLGGPIEGETTYTNKDSAGQVPANKLGTTNKRTFNKVGDKSEQVADEYNRPINEAVKKTAYGDMHKKRGYMVKEDGTYVVKTESSTKSKDPYTIEVEMEPGVLNVPKGMTKNYVQGQHGIKEEKESLNEAFNKKVKLSQKRFVSNKENSENKLNKRYIVSESLDEKELSIRFKQLLETHSFKGIQDGIDGIRCSAPVKTRDEIANEEFENAQEGQLLSVPMGGVEDNGFVDVPKGGNSLVVFKLAESDIKANKTYIKDHYTNKIVLNPLKK